MTYANIVLEELEPGIFLVTVNRPKALNALNGETLDEIAHAVAAVGANAAARVLLVTGAGDKAFVAGADIAQMQSFSSADAQAFSEKGNRTFRSLELLPIPAIALVNGFALGGGCELAMACDWVIASERAQFGQPEVNLGVVAGFGGTQRLPRLVGRALAMELLVTGRMIKADEALEMNLVGDPIGAEEAFEFGLVNAVVVDHELFDTALAWARKLAGQAPLAIQQIKEVSHKGDLDEGIAAEKEGFALAFSSEDAREGIGAFLGKRTPKFQGK
jgi:enoyl-CoA hydratase